MKLQQLRYIREVARRGMNVSAAAQSLYTSQPGVSKQILQLEEELGVQIFLRSGKHLTGLTPAGEQILAAAGDVLLRVDNIRQIAQEFASEDAGSLSIATTHTQSRYVLPAVISRFVERYPRVSLHMHQGTPLQIAEMTARGDADFAIATEAMERVDDLVMMPCYRWNRVLLLPAGHPLLALPRLGLADMAAYPIVTYVSGFTGRSKLDEAFRSQNLTPRVVVTAADADVIKTYVRLGVGIGIVASMAWEEESDRDLVAVDVSHLFEYSTTRIGVRRGAYLRRYMRDFATMFAPLLTDERIGRALACSSQAEVDQLFAAESIPVL
ncbi:MAG: HTH-type transcriptional regulator CysB [Pseudomonadales bacterium]|nr:HTH-type transcriptional regulator CysB [Pseudomonadales bacterium]MCP5331469.1 HTH-type transcriptional regulator CysB [Pseudomonadales bacterium]MCP5343352.1 HTH-type transcriptional regulator CysB [Pseudomonadales bacterium]